MARLDVRKMNPEDKEAFHRRSEALLQAVKYAAPKDSKKPKDVLFLAKTDLLSVLLQVVRDGGENNLHYHTHSDTLWMVLKGRVRFYGVGDKVLGEFGEHEGFVVPGGSRYWFEKIGDRDLEILQVIAKDQDEGEGERINLDRHKQWMQEKDLKVYE